MIRLHVLLIFTFCLPSSVMAAVTINEVAWMGSSVSANHEWIELYNDGGAVSLDGWILTDNENLSINLAGTISANSFAVLERTSDESAPGVAFLTYAGALKNTGTTLSLYRVGGGLEDQVAGGTDWQNIGGDNVTKETAQYTPGGWITAVATPGQQNATHGSQVNEVLSVATPATSARLAEPVKRETITLVQGVNQLSLQITAPEQVFVNQPVEFEVEPSGVGRTIENSLNYSWNFGDANVSSEKEPTHVYEYPGTYVVHLNAEFASQEAEGSVEVTVLPIAVSLTTNKEDDVQINNDSAYTIDLSDYRLRGHEVLELPQNTRLLPRQTITIPKEKIKASENALVALYDSAGALVASILPDYFDSEVTVASPNTKDIARNSKQPVVTNQAFYFATPAKAAEVENNSVTGTTSDIDMVVEEVNKGVEKEVNWPVWLLIVLLLVSSVVILMQPTGDTDSLDKHE